ncbi:hypothetical protein FIBSPDRAFT_959869 [Athelia psychrophila]|uniref:Uncharacterized protein n=1 Tax=Athelia psychrophila TaxID=1759441 RepID=A0A166CYZ0_9AGAM|nr:hypothetical protein FIBSPDRAFT_959869 [Fibularhizoctonia sp. CBS 109695]
MTETQVRVCAVHAQEQLVALPISPQRHKTPVPPQPEHAERLIIFDPGVERVLSATPDGNDICILASGISTLPDGVIVDTRPGKGQIYVTCMGHSTATNNGSLSARPETGQARRSSFWTGLHDAAGA